MEKGLPRIETSRIPSWDPGKLPQDADGERIAARVNGTSITLRMVMGAARKGELQAKDIPHREQVSRVVLAPPALEGLIRDEITSQVAAERKLEVSGQEITRYIDSANRSLPPGQKLQDDATARGLRMDELRKEIAYQLIGEKLLNAVRFQTPPASFDEIAAFVAEHPIAISRRPVLRASHIVLRSFPSDPPEKQQAVQQLANNILERLAQGADFAETARKSSQDAHTRELGGDLGYFTTGTMYQEFDEAAFQLKPGELSPIVRTPVGLHIIKVTDRQETDAPVLLRKRRADDTLLKIINEAVAKAKIEKFL